jgi:hypothetical protein
MAESNETTSTRVHAYYFPLNEVGTQTEWFKIYRNTNTSMLELNETISTRVHSYYFPLNDVGTQTLPYGLYSIGIHLPLFLS